MNVTSTTIACRAHPHAAVSCEAKPGAVAICSVCGHGEHLQWHVRRADGRVEWVDIREARS